MASPNDIHSSRDLAEKEIFFYLDIVSQNVPYKTNYWNKIAYLGIIFLRRKYLIHWYKLFYLHSMGSKLFRFYCASLYIIIQMQYISENINWEKVT